MVREVWLVRGEVTTEDAAEAYRSQGYHANVGDVEWQFSDGPPGERGSSSDYVDLIVGLADHTGYVIHY